jgi:transcriptional regulator with PAS, ATPase and Fis domain
VVPIVIPPLRERPEDIPLLVESFLEHYATKHKRRRKKLSAEALQIVQRYPWPGNVRQLRNALERVVLTSPQAVVAPEDLPDFLRAADQTASRFTIRPGMSLAEVEKLVIRQTLTHVTDNRDQAAKLLGISRRSLQYKLKGGCKLNRVSGQTRGQ